MRPATDRCRQGGVTLIEMIVAIVVGGILMAMVGMFARWQIQAYQDVSSRAALTDAADTAVGRLARELQSALPNSVRVSGNYLEFIPIRDAGRYRAETSGGADFPLDFGVSATATSFDVLGPPVDISNSAPADQVVIYNLGINGADAYADPPQNRNQPANTGAGLSRVQISGGFRFPFASPSNRFQVVGNPVTFECDLNNGVIRRYWSYGFRTSQPVTAADLSGSSAVLVDNVDRNPDPSLGPGCSFNYVPGALQRNGLVFIYLRLAANGETVNLMQQVEVLNTP